VAPDLLLNNQRDDQLTLFRLPLLHPGAPLAAGEHRQGHHRGVPEVCGDELCVPLGERGGQRLRGLVLWQRQQRHQDEAHPKVCLGLLCVPSLYRPAQLGSLSQHPRSHCLLCCCMYLVQEACDSQLMGRRAYTICISHMNT